MHISTKNKVLCLCNKKKEAYVHVDAFVHTGKQRKCCACIYAWYIWVCPCSIL